jgi:hypothetical protein
VSSGRKPDLPALNTTPPPTALPDRLLTQHTQMFLDFAVLVEHQGEMLDSVSGSARPATSLLRVAAPILPASLSTFV